MWHKGWRLQQTKAEVDSAGSASFWFPSKTIPGTTAANMLYYRKKPGKRGKRPVWDGGHTTRKVCRHGFAVLQIAEERSKRRHHQLGPYRTQSMRVADNKPRDVRCTQHAEVRSPVVQSLGQKQDDEHIHAAWKRNDRVIHKPEQNQARTAEAVQPYPYRTGKKQ